jgi:metal-responsive CopG/Arc/MetJ family transcriptional regulator
MKEQPKTNATGKVKISFDIPQKLLSELDIERKTNNHSRSNWLTLAVMEKLVKARKQEEGNDDLTEK